MTVNVRPLPLNYRDIPARLRPMPAPVFTDGDPSEADVQEAIELFKALDPESRAWYRSEDGIFADLDAEPKNPRRRSRRTQGAES